MSKLTDEELAKLRNSLFVTEPLTRLLSHLDAITAERDWKAHKERELQERCGRYGEHRNQLEARIRELEAELTQTYRLLNNANQLVENSTARADNAEHNLGNLLARIFGDGGHHQAAIQNDELATLQADTVICETRRLLDKAQFDLATQTARADAAEAAVKRLWDYCAKVDAAEARIEAGEHVKADGES